MIKFNQFGLSDGNFSYVEYDGKTKIEPFELGEGLSEEESAELLANAIIKNNNEYNNNKRDEKFQRYWFPLIMFFLGKLSSLDIKEILSYIISLFS